jgi:hypothetical protein
MRLINNIADLKRHIIVAATFDFEKVLPFAKRAERKIILDLVGQEQYDTIVIHILDPESSSAINQVKLLFEEAVANYSLYMAMPTINILITNSGTKVSENKEATNADWKDKRDLNRSLLKTYNEALDDAFQIMEENVADFPEWRDSKYYTVFKDLMVSQTTIFNLYFNIQKSRQTFVACKPSMREVEEQYLIAMLGDATLIFLKKTSADIIVTRAQQLAQKAIVALTVAKIADTGTFSFTETSFTVSTDQMPWEKTNLELSEEKLARLRKAKQTAGEEYLKALKKLIVANPLIFTAYQDKTETGITPKIIRKKSGLFL